MAKKGILVLFPTFSASFVSHFVFWKKSKLLQTLPTAFPFCARKFGLEEVAIFKCYTKLFKPVSKSYMPPTPTTVHPWLRKLTLLSGFEFVKKKDSCTAERIFRVMVMISHLLPTLYPSSGLF